MPVIYWIWIFILMLLIHIIEDFHIQGQLAQMKQRVWWINQPTYSPRYKYDYIAGLFAHGFEWAVLIHIPIFYYIGISEVIFISIFVNAVFHAIIDHMKCNQYQLDLIQDQLLHTFQICMTLIYLFVIYG